MVTLRLTEMICQWSSRKWDVDLSLEHVSSDFKSQLHQASLSNATSRAEREGDTSLWEPFPTMCGRGRVCPHTQAVPGGRLMALIRLPSSGQSCVLERCLLRLSRGGGGGVARLWPSTEKQPCTDGGAAVCTVVGPPSTGEHGWARSELALTTFLSWQPCTHSSSLVQANGFAAAPLGPGVSKVQASGLCICIHFPYLDLSTRPSLGVNVFLPFHGFPFGLYEHSFSF